MLHKQTEPIQQKTTPAVVNQPNTALTRLVGLCTLIALVGWTIGGYRAFKEVRRALLLVNLNMVLGQSYEEPSLGNVKFDGKVQTVEEVTKLLKEHRKALRAEKNRLFRQQRIVQGATTLIWIILMILTGVFMLCAAIAGLLGSSKTRKWHRRTAYWIFAATICTLGGIFVLDRWGGFPLPDDFTVVIGSLLVQCSYGIVIVIALLLTRKTYILAGGPSLQSKGGG